MNYFLRNILNFQLIFWLKETTLNLCELLLLPLHCCFWLCSNRQSTQFMEYEFSGAWNIE